MHVEFELYADTIQVVYDRVCKYNHDVVFGLL